jgi:hypothetical protein
MKTSAARQKLLRSRRKDGLVVRRVLVADAELTAVLFALGFLATEDPTPQQADEALSRWIHFTVTRHAKDFWPGV